MNHQLWNHRVPLENADAADGQKLIVLGAFQKGLLFNRYLVTLISSSAFKAYFQMLVDIYNMELLPSLDQRKVYKAYFSNLCPSMPVDAENVTKEIDDDEEGDPFSEDENIHSSFFRFLKTLVVHFTAKRALERHSIRSLVSFSTAYFFP